MLFLILSHVGCNTYVAYNISFGIYCINLNTRLCGELNGDHVYVLKDLNKVKSLDLNHVRFVLICLYVCALKKVLKKKHFFEKCTKTYKGAGIEGR